MAFEAVLSLQDVRPKRWQRMAIAVSLVLHGAALAAGLVHSLWQLDELPMPALQVTLTAAAPPPPPPPPPPARKRSSEVKPRPTRVAEAKPDAIVQPKETPKDEPKPKEEEAPGDEGQPGGVEGGVAGGVVGGVLGGVAPPPPPPPPKKTGPQMVSAKIARQQLLINPNVDPYRVTLPAALTRSGETYAAVLKICASAQGAVTDVRVMKGAGPAIDPQFPTVIRRWRYRPLMKDGQPVAFCYLLRYEVAGR